MMKNLLALFLLLCTVLLANYQIDFQKEDALQKGWTFASGVTQQGELTLVNNDFQSTALATLKMPLEAYASRIIRITAEAKAEKIAKGKLHYHAAKIEFCANSPQEPQYYKIQLPFGDSEWKTYTKFCSFPANAKNISLSIMVQKTTGTLHVRNLKIEVVGYALPIPEKANMELNDEVAEDGKGGWTDQGPTQDGRQFASQLGKPDFAGIPFRTESNGKCVLVFKSDEHFPSGLESADFPIRATEKSRCLYLLHTNAWGSKVAGRVRVTDTAGKSHVFEVKTDHDVADWYYGKAQLPNAYPAVTAFNVQRKNTALFVSRFPIPDTMGPIANVRFETAHKSIWLVLAATLSKNDIPMPELKILTIQENDDWKPAPYESAMRVQPGSILDRDPYVPHKSVDELGRVIIRDGHFWYEKDPQRRALFHVNAFHPSQLIYYDHKAVEAWVDEIARNGYNMIRPHFLDAGLLTDAKVPLEFNEKVWDNFEYAISLCRKRGIYILFDAMTSWLGYTPGQIWNEAGRDPLKSFKWRIFFDPAVRENWSKGVEKLLTHKNQYTGMRLMDDPILAMAVFFNEQEFGLTRPFVSKMVAPHWQEFLKKKYGTIEKLNQAWNHEKKYASFEEIPTWLPGVYGGVSGNDAALFVYSLESNLLLWYESEMRRFGFQGPMSGYNCGKSMYFNMLRSKSNSVTMNSYASHPSGSKVSQESPSSNALSYARQFAATRLTGKPFFITEHNVVFWNKHRYEQAFGTAAFAAYQDYEGITVHAEPINLRPREMGPFRTSKDPVMRACEFLSYFLFVRRDVQPARAAVRVRVNESDVFIPDGLKGGIPGEQTRASLFSQFSVECVGSDGKTLPLRSNECLVKLNKAAHVTIGQGYMETKDTANTSAELIVAELKKRGLLSAKNRTDGINRFESDTEELFLDSPKSFMQINTPRFQGICGLAGATAKLPALQIHKMTRDATLSLVSVDGNTPLLDSRRMALVFATNALNTGMTFQGEEMNINLKLGTAPALVLCGQFEVSITNKNAAQLNLYPLDFAGKRLKKITPSSVQGNTARFAVDMRNDGHAFFYELSVN
ncbi:MAG: beta-galactosidase [Victivallales bacterium]|nr:beta-galactosidase [Victivallales bacterium]